MTITLEFNVNTAFMKVDGMINGDSSYELQDKLNEVLEADVDVLELDLSNCRSISSTGIGKLLIFYKEYLKTEKEFKIVKCSENIYNLFQKIRFNQLIDIQR